MNAHLVQAVLLIGGTLAVFVLLGVHGWQRSAPRPDRVERRRQRSIRAHARDLALGPALLVDELEAVTTFDDATDDAVPVDMPALMHEQDVEIGVEFVRDIEAHLAAGFGLIELEGAWR